MSILPQSVLILYILPMRTLLQTRRYVLLMSTLKVLLFSCTAARDFLQRLHTSTEIYSLSALKILHIGFPVHPCVKKTNLVHLRTSLIRIVPLVHHLSLTWEWDAGIDHSRPCSQNERGCTSRFVMIRPRRQVLPWVFPSFACHLRHDLDQCLLNGR